MQTFLPHADFTRSAAVLDPPRLGKQRVEVLQVLRALELPDYAWSNHPAVVMWRGRTPALVCYGLACVRAWTALGHADSTEPMIREFSPDTADLSQEALGAAGLLPSWLGDEAVQRSHRSALVRKDLARYGPLFGDVPDDLPYTWPGADPTAPAPPADTAGAPLWVVRAPDAAALGSFVADGFVGLDAASGVVVDALAPGATAGSDGPPPERGTAERKRKVPTTTPVRKPSPRAVRQLRALADDVVPGDEVAVLAGGESALLVGRVSGDYEFRAGAGPVLHRRPVTWERVLGRSSVARPYLLQDPRALFRVRLAV